MRPVDTTVAAFDKTGVGAVSLRLQQVCFGCAHRPTTLRCDHANCPIGLSRKVLGDFLRTGDQLVREALPTSVAVPAGANLDHAVITDVLHASHAMCQRCMLHLNTCFLNVAYGLLELALGRTSRKPVAKRPADIATT